MCEHDYIKTLECELAALKDINIAYKNVLADLTREKKSLEEHVVNLQYLVESLGVSHECQSKN